MVVWVFLPLLQNIVFSTQSYKKYVPVMESKPKINTRISKHYSCRIRKKFFGRAGFILRYSTVFYIFNRSCHPFVQTYFCWTFSCYFFFYLKILRCYRLEFHWTNYGAIQKVCHSGWVTIVPKKCQEVTQGGGDQFKKTDVTHSKFFSAYYLFNSIFTLLYLIRV